MMGWTSDAAEVIAHVHEGLAEGATLAERKRAVDQAFPFGERRRWPYRAWLNARRRYLVRYGYTKPGQRLTPLEQAIAEARP
jgi:hypothetical protein